MVKIQIQLPDDLYERVKQLAKQKGMVRGGNAAPGSGASPSSIPRPNLSNSPGRHRSLAAWVGKD